MISFKEATIKAYEFIKEVPGYENKKDILVEEVEKSEDNNYWLITLGYLVPTSYTVVQKAFGSFPEYRKEYKRFKIDAKTGEVESMTIRTLD